ncbi:hypothetical protein D3C84_765620 [compost metagenome]
MPGHGRTQRRPQWPQDPGQGQALRAGRRRHQHPRHPPALQGAGPAPAHRQAHLPAPGELLRRAVRPADQPLLRRAAVDLFRSFPVGRRHHRAPVLQAGSTAAAAGPDRHPARPFRHRQRPAHGTAAAHQRDAGPAARRLPPGQRRGQGRTARRRQPGARLPNDRLHLGRCAPGLPQHGRDPVRRRGQGGIAAACRRRLREDAE